MAGISKMKINKYIKSLLLFMALIFFYKCANQLPPPGGEIDLIPPEVVAFYPPNETTNYEENYIEIEFSEYVDKRSVREAFFISPALEGNIDFNWSGTTVEIEFEDTLKKDITYTITFGTDIKDLNNGNNMASAFSLVFSTGDEIDKGIISGRVYDPQPLGILIFAYVDDSTYNPITTKPKYVSQVGTKGDFKLRGLADGIYKIAAVRDDFRDQLYNIGDDHFGVPHKEIVLKDSQNVVSNLLIKTTVEDTLKPSVTNVSMTDNNHFLIEFSEFIDSSKISTNNFYIFDSTSSNKIEIDFLFKGSANKRQLFLSVLDSIQAGENYYLISSEIPDNHHNLSEKQENQIVFNAEKDTLIPKVKNIVTPLASGVIGYKKPEMIINFDDAIRPFELNNTIWFKDKNDILIPVYLERIDDAAFQIISEKKLSEREEYFLEINLENIIDAAGNIAGDSINLKTIKSNSSLDYSGISGKILTNLEQFNFVLTARNLDKQIDYDKILSPNEVEYSLEELLPGKYVIEIFEDRNKNGKYDYGSIYPYELSELFSVYPDTLNLRARWPITDVFIRIEN